MLWAKRKAEKVKSEQRAELPLEQGHLAESANLIEKDLTSRNNLSY